MQLVLLVLSHSTSRWANLDLGLQFLIMALSPRDLSLLGLFLEYWPAEADL